jgi:hypothetical protein
METLLERQGGLLNGTRIHTTCYEARTLWYMKGKEATRWCVYPNEVNH